MPWGSSVPDNRMESEGVLATKCMLESEKRFHHKTSKSRARAFHFLGEHLQGPEHDVLISLLHLLCGLRRTWLKHRLRTTEEDRFPGPHLRSKRC